MTKITVDKALIERVIDALPPVFGALNHQTLAKRLRAALAEPAQTTCNCRWEGDTQVQQCTLHEAHVAAIHEWSERAKTAEKKLAEPAAEPVAWWVVNKTTDEKFATTRPDDWNNLNWLKYPLFTSPPPPAEVPLLTEDEFQSIKAILRRQEGWDGDGWDLALKESIEQAVRQKAGL